MRPHALRHSIGTKIFGAFLAMSAIIAGLGAYGRHVLDASGRMVTDTYDYPMMSINYGRAASVDFLEMQNDALRAEEAAPAQKKQLGDKIDTLAATLSDDLDVAEERATAADERNAIAGIRRLVGLWQSERHAAFEEGRHAGLADLDQKILVQFDLLVEYNADHGFVDRRQAVTQVAGYEDAVVGVTLAALLLAASVAFFVVRRIVRPLSAAARVAERIAAGEFQTAIPPAGKDETGVLLHSMQVMQDSIALQMAREKARAQSAEGRLMDAVENSGEGIILSDGGGRIVVANSELARLFPAIAENIAPGKPLGFVLGLIETQCRTADTVEGAGLERLSAEPEKFPAGAERLLPDGRWIRISAGGTSEGGTMLFFSDFTDIKAREEGYRLAKQQAEAANAAKSRFLANMGHELRTPLNAVIGFSEILSSEIFGSLGDPRYVGYAGDILRSGHNLLAVINNVLDLAKSDAGAIELRKRVVDIGAMLRDCVRLLEEQFRDGNLRFAGPEEPVPVLASADEERLRQVFLNLLSNAIKFTGPGGLVTLAVGEDGSGVKVEIGDTGIGMSPEDIRTALTPFAQVDNRLERQYEGAGLGLPLAKAFTELHGGTLAVISERGRGTTVTVRLPGLAWDESRRRAAG